MKALLLAALSILLCVGIATAQQRKSRLAPTPTPQAQTATPSPTPLSELPRAANPILPVAIPGVLFLISLFIIAFLFQRWTKLKSSYHHISEENAALQSKHAQAVHLEAESHRLQKETEEAYQQIKAQHSQLQQDYSSLQDRMRPVVDADAEAHRIIETAKTAQEDAQTVLETTRATAAFEESQRQTDRMKFDQEAETRQKQANETLASLEERIRNLRSELAPLDEEAHLHSFGFYKPRYDFADSARYQVALEEIRVKQKRLIKE